MVKCITYNEHSSKNNQGLVHQLHLNNKSVTHYAKPSLGERCFVHLFELYTSKLPSAAKDKDIFYCKPKARLSQDGVWYYSTPVGHNLLARRLKDMFISAGLNTDNIQNHSLRATSISRMYEKCVPEKQIMEISGHQSVGGVRSYERTTDAQKKEVSDILSGGQSRVALQVVNSAVIQSSSASPQTGATGKENQKLAFSDIQNCTFNFHFN